MEMGSLRVTRKFPSNGGKRRRNLAKLEGPGEQHQGQGLGEKMICFDSDVPLKETSGGCSKHKGWKKLWFWTGNFVILTSVVVDTALWGFTLCHSSPQFYFLMGIMCGNPRTRVDQESVTTYGRKIQYVNQPEATRVCGFFFFLFTQCELSQVFHRLNTNDHTFAEVQSVLTHFFTCFRPMCKPLGKQVPRSQACHACLCV